MQPEVLGRLCKHHQELGRLAFGQRCRCQPWGGLGSSSFRPPEELESFLAHVGFVQGKTAAIRNKSKVLKSTNAARDRRNL